MAYVFEVNGVLYKGDCVNVVSAIRRKIGDGYIETVVGSGYRFVG